MLIEISLYIIDYIYCITIFTISLYHYITISLYSLYHYITVFTISLYHCIHYITVFTIFTVSIYSLYSLYDYISHFAFRISHFAFHKFGVGNSTIKYFKYIKYFTSGKYLRREGNLTLHYCEIELGIHLYSMSDLNKQCT